MLPMSIEDQSDAGSMAVIRVSSAIARQLKGNAGSGGVLVDLGIPLLDSMAVLREIVAQLGEQYLLEADDPVLLDLQETERLPAVAVMQCADVKRLLDRLSVALVAHGFDDARLKSMPVVNQLHGHGRFANPDDVAGAVSAYVSLPGTPVKSPGMLPAWDNDLAAADDALSLGVGWALQLDGAERLVDVATGPYTTRVVAQGARRAMRERLRDRDLLRMQVNVMIVYSGHKFRAVSLPPAHGSLILAEGNELLADFDWREASGNLTSFVRDLGPACEYAHLTQTLELGTGAEHGQLRSNQPWSYGAGPRLLIDAGQLLDAFGVMRLTRQRADQFGLHPGWNLEPSTDPDHVLAVHTNQEAWFAGPQVDMDVLNAGRRRLEVNLPSRTGPDIDLWEQHRANWRARESSGFRSQTYWER